MAKHTLDDDRPGYYLPEDSQQRLVRLSDHIKFLLRLMQPLADAPGEPAREVRLAEVAGITAHDPRHSATRSVLFPSATASTSGSRRYPPASAHHDFADLNHRA